MTVKSDIQAAPEVEGGPAGRPARSCGSCTACCTVMGIRSIGKAAGCRCPHLVEQGGCGIYSSRPSVCAEFTCLWLADRRGLLGESHRPDRCGLVLTDHEGHPGGIMAREVHAGAAETKDNVELIRYLRQFVNLVVQPFNSGSAVAVSISAKRA